MFTGNYLQICPLFLLATNKHLSQLLWLSFLIFVTIICSASHESKLVVQSVSLPFISMDPLLFSLTVG
ncbi:hypothetical protein ERO13_D05G310950v2 [Gossypium hirsutum]|nr:hypothetical protein ERO13_D05G310950v2 [Gossypium hirsutum]